MPKRDGDHTGTRIQEQRRLAGLTQRAFAERIPYSYSSVASSTLKVETRPDHHDPKQRSPSSTHPPRRTTPIQAHLAESLAPMSPTTSPSRRSQSTRARTDGEFVEESVGVQLKVDNSVRRSGSVADLVTIARSIRYCFTSRERKNRLRRVRLPER
ncbi:hypothetical protein FY004_25195 [Streptomyces parvus]|uniref:Helix-turn-helix domain-containing protein n=1 Tax=Streptomyces parvus TaxID=66428 RepID=A0A5D4IPB1_9ACTN|nr:hypothetical protein FY004_25195 [Streptomyces parvus]